MYHLRVTCQRSFASTARANLFESFKSKATSPFPVIPTCPSPTCPCAETPPNLDIDRTKALNGTAAPYSQHVLISTGKTDWPSKIENEKDEPWGRFAANLKRAVGPRRPFRDPYKNILVSTSSFTGADTGNGLLLFPSFTSVHPIPSDDQGDEPLHKFIQDVLFSQSAQSQSAGNHSKDQFITPTPIPITKPTILICSHASRDSRCGILGPLLQSEFTRQLSSVNFQSSTSSFNPNKVNVGCISHIGGHVWAGNVIIYIPPQWRGGEEASEPVSRLAGMGIWYGRVEPKHVEGIVKETIMNGKIIREMFRGGVDAHSKPLRL